MNKKQQIIFRSSIITNIFLVIIIIWGFINTNFVKEQLIFEQVQHNLVELEGLITHQKKYNWSEPNLVTTEVRDILNGIYIGVSTGKYLKTISSSDIRTLENLASILRQYPHDELYEFSTLTTEDKQNFEELQIKLREVGLGLRITISKDWDSFMDQIKTLEENLSTLQNK
ncbi:hypothetical protein VQL36_15290 [Chengkuizengella sp. SCS-71B]|uniref:hypothetical protein n=1 Tax=Chengkuizengella sp. SCS-71B TaxID=3115290 RepID=UPI0032C22F49